MADFVQELEVWLAEWRLALRHAEEGCPYLLLLPRCQLFALLAGLGKDQNQEADPFP